MRWQQALHSLAGQILLYYDCSLLLAAAPPPHCCLESPLRTVCLGFAQAVPHLAIYLNLALVECSIAFFPNRLCVALARRMWLSACPDARGYHRSEAKSNYRIEGSKQIHLSITILITILFAAGVGSVGEAAHRAAMYHMYRIDAITRLAAPWTSRRVIFT